MTALAEVKKWRVFQDPDEDGGTYWWVAKSPEGHEAEFPTHAEAHAHVRNKQIEQYCQENPLGALIAGLAMLAAAQQMNEEPQQHAIEG